MAETQPKISKTAMEQFEKWCGKHGVSGDKKERAFEKFMQIVEKVQYEPGEAVGVIAAQSISEPATQMCTDYCEKIILKFKDKIKITAIGEFIDRALEEKNENVNGYEIYDVPEDVDLLVPSLNQNEKIEWKKIRALCRHKSPDFLIKVKTASGRSIKATDFHSFVTRRNNNIISIAGKDLHVGDRIPSIKLLPENCIEVINAQDYLESSKIEIKDGKIYRLGRASKSIPSQFKLDFLFGWFIGAYLSEGGTQGSQVGISNVDENFISNAKAFAERIGLDSKDKKYQGEFGIGRTLVLSSTTLSNFIISTCGKGSENKKIPQFAYNAKEEFISGLLRGYFDGDGNVSVKRKMIRISSNSKELLDGICILLARFGIFAHKVDAKTKVTIQHGLVIPYKYAPVFLEKIGSDITKKKNRLVELSKLAGDFWSLKSQDFTDMIGGFDDVLYRIAKKLKYPTRYINNFTKRQKIGRTVLFRYIKIFEALAKEKNIDISKDIELLNRMFNSDVVWDSITEIKNIKPSSDYVYDITIEDNHTFTTFDGIITHNTMRSYTLATQRDRLSKVTQGLPRLIEIFDSRKTFERNMKIYLKPKFNDKDSAAEIAEKIKMRTVADVITSDSLDIANGRIELEFISAEECDTVKELFRKVSTNFDISTRANRMFIKPPKDDIKLLRKVRRKILDAPVSGFKGIKAVVVSKEEEEWVIQTAGTNLRKVLSLEEVDISRTITNDIHQVLEVLGIEAARNAILRETMDTMEEQGLDVDSRHLLLLADIMTLDGVVKSIGRYGVSGDKASVLARANFEETKKHIVNASFYGEEDNLAGVIENVLIGGIVPIGTGMVKIGIDVSKLMHKK